MRQPPDITPEDIRATYQAIAAYLRRTPVVEVEGDALGVAGVDAMVLKLEQLPPGERVAIVISGANTAAGEVDGD